MPQDLAALLVEEGAVSQADMERAVARQAELGGALDTALLELELIGEGHLLSFLAHAAGIPAAPAAAWAEVDARARRVFPAKVAERHRLAPFALDGRELSVVAVHPVDAAAIDEIGFMLSLTLVPHVGPEWRVQELIQRLYGGQLPARFAKLGEAARSQPAAAAPAPMPEAEPEPMAAPASEPAPEPAATPEAAPPALPAVEDAFFAAGEAGAFAPPPSVEPPLPPEEAPPVVEPQAVGVAEGEAAPPPGAPAAAADETSFAGIEPERPSPSGFSRGDEPAEPLLFALEQALDAYDAMWAEPPAGAPAAPAGEPVPAAGADGEPPPPAAPPESGPEGAAAEGPEAEATAEPEPEGPPPELDRSAPPGWTIDDALAALTVARHRDEVVLTALRFARDFFEFSALFAVTRDAVVGHDALGPEEDARLRARGTAIYAADAGIVKTVLETRAPYLGPVVRDTVGTSNVLDGLWRGTPRTVLLYPILLGDRPVAVLYADNGEAPVSARRLGDLLLFLSTVGGVFERIIRARKKRRRPAAAPPPSDDPPPAAAAEPPSPGPAPSWMAPPPDVAEPPEPAEAPAPVPETAAVEPAPPGDAVAPPVPAPAHGDPAIDAAMRGLFSGHGGVAEANAILDLVLDTNPAVAARAREAVAARRGDAAVKPLPERLRRALLSGVGDRPVHAARALGALRDVASIPILIQALEGGAPETSDAAAEALAQITLQRFGANAQRWLRWWKENRGRSRAEWLFAALTSGDRGLRLAASGELRAAAIPPVKYSADLPAAELEAAARAWWVWWSRQGIAL